MSEKIALSKQELKRQKDLLRRFQRYLPTLTLKMQQLKLQLNRIETQLRQKTSARDAYIEENKEWTAVFGEEIGVERYVQIDGLQITHTNLAGILIPTLVAIHFAEQTCDLFRTPLWVDHGVAYLKERINIDAEIEILRVQHELVDQELRVTTQRVNLFEKIRIPRTKKIINHIIIYLGDQYTAAVVCGKMAKKKLTERASA